MAAVEFGSTSLISDPSLVNYYKLENVNDEIGSDTLTNNNVATFTAGKFNNAATLVKASSQSLTHAPGTDIFSGDADRAFSCWFKPASQPGADTNMTPLMWGDNVRVFAIWYSDVGGVKKLGVTDGNTMDSRTNQILSTGTYYNLIASYAASGQTWKLYLDGALFTTSVSDAPAAGSNALDIGNYFGVSHFADGQVDDVAIFSRQLTQADIDIINGIVRISEEDRAFFI